MAGESAPRRLALGLGVSEELGPGNLIGQQSLGAAQCQLGRLVLHLRAGQLRVSVYQDDTEAYELWQKLEPYLHERRWIYKFGENDNFWPAGSPSQGPNGVCGPCSEIFHDLGESYNKPELKGADDPSNLALIHI